MTNPNISRLKQALERAEDGYVRPEFDIPGKNGKKVRSLLSFIQARRFLEVGTGSGSTFLAAVSQNDKIEVAQTIDSFVFHKETKEIAAKNIQALNNPKYQLIEGSLYMLDYSQYGNEFDTFFFDGYDSAEGVRRAFTCAWPHLAEESVLIFNNGDDRRTASGIQAGLADVDGEVVYGRRIHSDKKDDSAGWWNGLWCAVVRKRTSPKVGAVCMTYNLPNRLRVLNESVECFLRQTHSNKHLYIVNDKTEVVFSHPQVDVINQDQRTSTLGDKLNFGMRAAIADGCEVLMVWDDDDLSLPHRMRVSVDKLKDGVGYYNPKAYYFKAGNNEAPVRERMTGYSHNCSAFTASAFQSVGEYAPLNGPYDAVMDKTLSEKVKTVIGEDDPRETAYIYCWGRDVDHISGDPNIDEFYATKGAEGVPGVYPLQPSWHSVDYHSWCRGVSKLHEWHDEDRPVRGPEPRIPDLTIGIPTSSDYEGVWATIQSLRIHHKHALQRCEIVVLDNSPKGSKHSKCAEHLCQIGKHTRHIEYNDRFGTAVAKNEIFNHAQGNAVLVVDSHVMFPAGVIDKLLGFYEMLEHNTDGCGSFDLFHGPCMSDSCEDEAFCGTEFVPGWGTYMQGQWHVDMEKYYKGKPWEIWASGCGLFTCRRNAWLGFPSKARGFGGEEGYIQQKYRKMGYKVWCLPFLHWSHRFGNIKGHAYPLNDRVWNYTLAHLEVGMPETIEEVRNEFCKVGGMGVDEFDRIMREATAAATFPMNRSRVPFLNPDPGTQDWEREYLESGKFDCPHLGKRIGAVKCNIGCPSRQRENVSVHACELYDLAVLGRRRTDIRSCSTCRVLQDHNAKLEEQEV